MYRYLIRRLLTMLFLMWVMTAIIFALASTTGGGTDRLFSINAVTPFEIARQKSLFGIDRSPAEQYFTWIGEVLHGNFGTAEHRGTEGPSLRGWLAPMLGASLLLISTSLFFCVLVGMILGIFSALRPSHPFTRVIGFFSMINVSVPDFAIGILLMIVLSVQLRVLPTSGFSDPLLSNPSLWGRIVDRMRHLIMPAITLSFTYIAAFTEHVRKTFSDVMTRDYIRTARSKGLPEWKVIFKHALRNSFVPTLAAIFSSLPFFLGGIVVIEYLFAWPGVGLAMYRNIIGGRRGDFYTVLVITGLISFLSLIGSLLADILYAMVDPRITAPLQKSRRRINPGTFGILLVGAMAGLALYHGRLFSLYERIGSSFWAQLALGVGLLAIGVPLQWMHQKRRLALPSVPAAPGNAGFRISFSFNMDRVRDFFQRIAQPGMIVGFLVLWLLILGSFYPMLRGFQKADDIPLNMATMLAPPSFKHILGTDTYGRDLLTVLLLVGRQTLFVAFSVAFIGTVAGTALGVLCGFLQGFFDGLVMVAIDLVSSVPSYFLVFLVAGTMGRSTGNIILVLSVFGIIEVAKVVRAQVLTVRQFPFIEAAQALGNSGMQIIVRHLLRNLMALMWGQGIIFIGRSMLLLCSLGYLQVLEFPTWGTLAAESIRSSQYMAYWWTCINPIAMIFISVLAINSLGKGVLKAFDPFARK